MFPRLHGPHNAQQRDEYRAAGDCVCPHCGKTYREHPLDWFVIGWGNYAWLHVLCNGDRVKL